MSRHDQIPPARWQDPPRLDTPLDARGKPAMAALVEEVNRLTDENARLRQLVEAFKRAGKDDA